MPHYVVTSIDVNTAANDVYRHNFPDTVNLNRNIESIDAKEIIKLSIDSILMSPPCQPFTRLGLKKDVLDERTNSFLHVLNLIPQIDTLKYILVENVKGFETSKARDRLLECILKSGFNYKEFILSPCQFGIPNTRHRYYLLAKKKGEIFYFQDPSLDVIFPKEFIEERETCQRIEDILQENLNESEYLVSSKILNKHASILDVKTPASSRSCCFTKAYTRYVEGTGSVFCPFSDEIVTEKFSESKKYEDNLERKAEILASLKLRYFTPREVARLMSFPETFNFPKTSSKKQMYRLLGNSINVHVVSKLIKLFKHGDNDT